MSARDRMTMRAQFERNAAATRDRNNQAAAPDWQPLALAQYAAFGGRVPCFLWPLKEVQTDGPVNIHVAHLRMGIPVDAGITAADRLAAVYDGAGQVVLDHAARITGDERYGRSHRELLLEVVGSSVGASA